MSHLLCSPALSYGPDPRQACDLFVPQSCDQQPLLVLLHAGWWQRGSRRDLLATALTLAERGYAVASVDYRLLQGSRSGADLIADVVAALPVVHEECQVLGANLSKTVLVGSGAGGLLGLSALPALATAGQAISGLAMVGTAPGLTPWEGCPDELREILACFAGNDQVADPLAAGQVLPPVLLLHGDRDDEVPAVLAKNLHGRLVEGEGSSTLAIISGAGHRFLEDSHTPAGRSACSRLTDWLSKLPHKGQAAGEGPVIGEPAWLTR